MAQEQNDLMAQFKNYLLFKKKDQADEMRPSIQDAFTPDQIQKAEQWADQCQKLIEEAIGMAWQGKTRDSLEFNTLYAKSRQLGGNASGALCQSFDKAVLDARQDNISMLSAPIIIPQKTKGELLYELENACSRGKKAEADKILQELNSFYPGQDTLTEIDRRKHIFINI